MERLLVVETGETAVNQLVSELEQQYRILRGAGHARGRELFQKYTPKVVVVDLGSAPDNDGNSEGFRTLQWMLVSEPETKVIVLAGNEDREAAHLALRYGAYDFQLKPVNTAELGMVIRRAFQLSALEEERRKLKETLERRGLGLEGMVGQCPAMQRVFSAMQMVAASDLPVLITGESGTGKELIARTIKSLSARADGPFVSVNCGATAKELLEQELFGPEPGDRNAALSALPGKLEQARKGTLFLDEPAELPHHLQLRLLRLLQAGKPPKVAMGDDVGIDTRIICAAGTRPVRQGELLDDLYYRISVITLELPPLRSRGEDIMLLAHLFLRRYAQACNAKARGFSRAAALALQSHAWPGNVRELEGRVQRGVIMSDGPCLEPGSLGLSGAETAWETGPARGPTLREARDRVERKAISAAVDSSRGNLAKASELLDVSRSTLYDLLKKHGLFTSATRQ